MVFIIIIIINSSTFTQFSCFNYLPRCYRCNYYNYFVLLWTLLMGMSQLVSCMWHKHSRFHICSIFVCGSLWYPNPSYVISHFNLICHQCCFSYPDSDIMYRSFQLVFYFLYLQEKVGETKVVMTSRKSKDRQHNGQWPSEKGQTTIYKTLCRKLKIEPH